MIVTPGAVAALFIVHTALLEPGDHIVVARPNYATNVETPRAIGADVTYLDLAFEDGWVVDPARIAGLMTPRTRLVSLTTPHNPTGTTLDEATLRDVIAVVERAGARLLLDETYREMTFGAPLPVAAGLSPSVVSVSSLSKTYGLPGIRIGWLVTRDRALRDTFLAAKEQILISGSLVDETIALAALRRRPAWLPRIRARIDEAFGITARWLVTATLASSGSRRGAASSASRGSVPASRWTPTRSTGSCSRSTARSSDPGTGSSSRGRTSGWATAGRRSLELSRGPRARSTPRWRRRRRAEAAAAVGPGLPADHEGVAAHERVAVLRRSSRRSDGS